MFARSRKSKADRFAFGQNWQRYVVNHLTPERITNAQQKILRFLCREDLHGSVFLDIGCGSGIHSLGAWKSGALRVISFDFDADSVAATEHLRQSVGTPDNWVVMQGSVLDRSFLATLPAVDIVYSWGVLHHTGAMWEAVENATSLVSENGLLYIALYTSDLFIDRTPQYWLDVKRRYNQSSSIGRLSCELWYALRFDVLPRLVRFQNPFQKWLDYRHDRRGMAYWTDIRDWLGGWPMEFADIKETLSFCEHRMNLELLNLGTGAACSEYLFRRHGAVNDWNQRLADRIAIELNGPFSSLNGWVYAVDLSLLERGETRPANFPDEWTLLEDGHPTGLGRCPIDHVQRMGLGRFGCAGKQLFFATSDNSDPNANGRKYSLWRFEHDAEVS